MNDAQLRSILDEHEDSVLDALERALQQQRTDREALRQALRPQLSPALTRSYECGYREAQAARHRSVARLQASLDTDVDFQLASFPVATLEDAQALEDSDGDAHAGPTEEHAQVFYGEADLGMLAEPGPASGPASANEDQEEEDPEEDSSQASPPPELQDGDDEEAGQGGSEAAGEEDHHEAAPGGESVELSKRARKSSTELEAQAEEVFTFIQEHPGTKAGEAHKALGIQPSEWRTAVRRLAEAGRTFYVGATRATVYFPIPERKAGGARKLTRKAFILALPDHEAEQVVEAGAAWGLQFNTAYVNQIRNTERRQADQAEALQAARQEVARTPRSPEAYRALRLAHTHAKRTDATWVACQVLMTFSAAEQSEGLFYDRYYAQGARRPLGTISLDLLKKHVFLADPVTTTVVDYLVPALLERYGRPTAALGYTDALRVDPAHHSLLGRSLIEASQFLGLEPPPVYQRHDVPRSLFLIHGDIPTMGFGADKVTNPNRAAFLAGTFMSYLLPGHYALPLVNHEPELRRWVNAALSLSRGEPVQGLTDLEQATLEKQVDPDERGVIRQQAGDRPAESLDLRSWLRDIEMTADRVGLLFSNDLMQAIRSIRGGFEFGDEATEHRVVGLRLWSLTSDYLELRSLLGVALT